MSRLVSWAVLGMYVLFGWGIAAYAWAFGALTCESGCGGAGPAWVLSHESAEWSYYWKLGLAFALIATFTAFGAFHARALGLAGLALASFFAGVLWWRVDLASPNSAGDFWIYLAAGQALGIVAVVIGRRAAPSG